MLSQDNDVKSADKLLSRIVSGVSKIDYKGRAAARLRHLIATRTEADDMTPSRVGRLLGSDAAMASRIMKDERSPGTDTIGYASRSYEVSADYFFDPGPDDLDVSPYRRAAPAEPDAHLRTAMDRAGLTEDERDAIAGIDWTLLPRSPRTYDAICLAITYARESGALPTVPPGAGPALIEARRGVARVASQPRSRRRRDQ